jgi:putative transposase
MLGKKIWGRKRHLLVDTQGLPLAVKVHAASVQDRDGARLLLAPLQEDFPRLEKIWADSAYRGTLIDWVDQHLDCTLAIITALGTWVLINGEPVREGASQAGFQVQPKRWVIERTFGWLIRSRRLARDYEGLPAHSTSLIQISLSRLMLARLVPRFL